MTATTYTQANQFHLRGKDLVIQYSATSIAGVPLLNLEHKGTKKAFRGDEIRALESPLGTLITVTLEVIPDLKDVTLTVVIPGVNVAQNSEKVHTFAVVTTSHTSIGGPRLVKGQLQTYVTEDLIGTAETVIS